MKTIFFALTVVCGFAQVALASGTLDGAKADCRVRTKSQVTFDKGVYGIAGGSDETQTVTLVAGAPVILKSAKAPSAVSNWDTGTDVKLRVGLTGDGAEQKLFLETFG